MSIELINSALKVDELTSSQKLVLVAISNYANKDGLCYPSKGIISKSLKLCKRYIAKIFKVLEDKGLIIRKPRFAHDGRQLSNIFKVMIGSSVDKLSNIEKKITKFVHSLKDRKGTPFLNRYNSKHKERIFNIEKSKKRTDFYHSSAKRKDNTIERSIIDQAKSIKNVIEDISAGMSLKNVLKKSLNCSF